MAHKHGGILPFAQRDSVSAMPLKCRDINITDAVQKGTAAKMAKAPLSPANRTTSRSVFQEAALTKVIERNIARKIELEATVKSQQATIIGLRTRIKELETSKEEDTEETLVVSVKWKDMVNERNYLAAENTSLRLSLAILAERDALPSALPPPAPGVMSAVRAAQLTEAADVEAKIESVSAELLRHVSLLEAEGAPARRGELVAARREAEVAIAAASCARSQRARLESAGAGVSQEPGLLSCLASSRGERSVRN